MQYYDIKKNFNDTFKNYQLSEEVILSKFYDILNKYKINIKDLEYLGSGESSIVYSYKDDVIKLSFVAYKNFNLKDYINYSKHILQIDFIEEIDFGMFYKIYVLKNKKLNTKNIKNKDVYDLYSLLRLDGYLWYDTRESNIGKDENGLLYLLDYGELINLNVLDNNEINRELKHHIELKKEYDDYYKKMISGYFDKVSIFDKISNIFKTK